VPLCDPSYYVPLVSIPRAGQRVGFLKRENQTVMEGYSMRKISFLAATFLVALSSLAQADGLPPGHVKRLHSASPTPAGEVVVAPTNPQAKSQWNGYVDYRSVGLSSNPDDCNKGCAVTTGQ
jgi:hypothetical protein